MLAVDNNKESIQCAKENFQASFLQDQKIFDEKSIKLLEKRVDGNLKKFLTFFDNETPIFLIINPPRIGLPLSEAKHIIKYPQIKFLAYITCDLPKSLKTLKFLLTKGQFSLEKIEVIDMFPYTNKFETILILRREFKNKNLDSL